MISFPPFFLLKKCLTYSSSTTILKASVEALPHFGRDSMSVTIYDVARKAGVGIGTVSRAINESGSVAEHTKKKVLA